MTQAEHADQDVLELLAGNVLGDLTNEETQRFIELSEQFKTDTSWELERTAAAIELVGLGKYESMPSHLRRPLADAGREFLASRNSFAQKFADNAQASVPATESINQTTVIADEHKTVASAVAARPRAWRELLAWVCCAAAVVLCVTLWTGRAEVPREPVALSMAEARESFLVDNPNAMQLSFVNGPTPFDDEVTGDIVWDNEQQNGYMRFVNMPPNDPSVEQYQLWIIDPARDDEPIDGGVFNIQDGNVDVVPIQAKLKVVDPKAFAVTIEKPGGVVVSSQERLPLLAAVE